MGKSMNFGSDVVFGVLIKSRGGPKIFLSESKVAAKILNRHLCCRKAAYSHTQSLFDMVVSTFICPKTLTLARNSLFPTVLTKAESKMD